jgi:hypothetical protein
MKIYEMAHDEDSPEDILHGMMVERMAEKIFLSMVQGIEIDGVNSLLESGEIQCKAEIAFEVARQYIEIRDKEMIHLKGMGL